MKHFLNLTTEQLLIKENTRKFARKELLQRVRQANRDEKFDTNIFKKFGNAGLLGATIPTKYGGGGLDKNSYGIIANEIEYVDSSYRSALSVQSSLVMGAINDFGTDIQKELYLPQLASGEKIGAFGLTEPKHGSDPAGMETKAVLVGENQYMLNGEKTWITNAPIADLFVVWAKLDGKIRGFVIDRERNTENTLNTQQIKNKLGLRASSTGSIQMQNAKASLLPNVTGLKGPFTCLNNARFGIAWGSLGAAQACLDATIKYTTERNQFGVPLASKQLIQKKLADAFTEITLGLNMCYQHGQNETLDPQCVSMLKRNNCGKALQIARDCRDILGGNGISDEYDVMRHMNNLEVVNTYEGTHDIHALILGRMLTGLSAF